MTFLSLPLSLLVCYSDVKKMPLGKLSKTQIAKGFEVLEEIQAAMDQKKGGAHLVELSSKFFTTIPHNFGRNRPPTINNKEIVEKKKEMLMVRSLYTCIYLLWRLCWSRFSWWSSSITVLLCCVKVLADIELAQTLKSVTEKSQEEMIEMVPHPLDQDYMSLNCKLSLMDKTSERFKVGCYI